MGRVAKTVDDRPRKFGVLQQKGGSYTILDARFEPLTVVPVLEETAELACEDSSPVKFFDTSEEAEKNVEALKAKFAAQPKNQQ